MIREENENNTIKNERAFDSSIVLKDNAMLKHRMELYDQWDFEKNDELGLDVYKVTFGSDKIAWWNCPKCKSLYDMNIKSRAENPKRKARNCPYCAGKRVNHTNSLASLNPLLAKEWHPTKNGNMTPHVVTCGQDTKVWWLGAKCGHWWNAAINSRADNGCIYCSSNKTLKGFNDMWTTNPELAKQLADSEDGYRYMQSSHQKVDWKCSDCENIVKNKTIYNIKKYNLSCPRCSDGISFPEKFMYNLLKELGINFVFDESQLFSELKRYDFYLPDYNWIIETHGGQHYEESFKYSQSKSRTFKEEQDNDRLKEKLAKENGIDNYIVIDARYSTVEWIKNSILNSDIMNIIEAKGVDFEKIGQLASSSFVKKVCDLWNSGTCSAPQIAEKINMSHRTVVTYLNRGAEIGWCDYSVEVKKVVQLRKNSYFIHEWESSREIENQLGISIGNISAVCAGNRKTTAGFRWMYKEDYENYLLGNIKIYPLISKNAMSVVQLDVNLNLIETFPSQTIAAEAFGFASVASISNVCIGRAKTAGGFKWMLKEDYDALMASSS